MRSGTFGQSLMVVLFACAAVATAEPVRVIYVDAAAGGAKTGASWADAYNSLQDALTAAKAAMKPIEIRVAQGLYKPDQGAGITPGDQLATFQLLNGVALKGGYAGAAGFDPNARDVELYETILSGDLAGDGSDGLQTGQDDSCHIVTGSLTDSTAVMDGLAVTGGSRPISLYRCEMARGGTAPVFIDAGSPTIRDCHFVAGRGPGSEATVFLCNGSAPTIVNCVFSNNGVGMYSEESSPSLLDCFFTGNKQDAVNCDGSRTASFVNCRFESNGTGLDAYGSVTLTNCTFVDNSTGAGGWPESVSATNCLFERNGRAIDLSSGTLRLTGCRFDENSYGAVSGPADVIAVRCSFTGNTGSFAGGIEFAGNVTISDCTFLANTGRTAGAIMGAHVLTLRNCEFSGNIGGVGVVDTGRGVLKATRCLFMGNSGQRAGVISRLCLKTCDLLALDFRRRGNESNQERDEHEQAIRIDG